MDFHAKTNKPIPFSISEAAVEAVGTAFHYKRPLFRLLVTAGVSPNFLRAQPQTASKFTIFRSVWEELDTRGTVGREVQYAILAQLVSMDAPLPEAKDPVMGSKNLEKLKKLVRDMGLLVSPEELIRVKQREEYQHKQEVRQLVGKKREELRQSFFGIHSEPSTQKRGYLFEEFLGDFFRWGEIEYTPPVSTRKDQLDGMIRFDSFNYLIEAKWRDKPANLEQLEKLKSVINRRLHATRGLFVSQAGFVKSAVEDFTLQENHLILMDGQDIALILEEKMDLEDALSAKIEAATTRGNPYLKVADML
ncbi:restriction endonuclease [Corynebacterium ulcerans]|uniref:restriction endonuclease n=1 Tax=Corynebacterium ulcerans TaxID=65058 RepID=UPI0034A119C6